MRADIAFLALAQNCAETLPGFLQMLAALRNSGIECVAFVGENGSRDSTNTLLLGAQLRGDVTYVSTAFMADEPERLRRMARGRQHLKEIAENSGLCPKFVCVVDIDNIMRRPPAADVVRGALAKLQGNDVFAVSATSAPHYYDLLAYEDETLSFEYLLDEISKNRRNIIAYYRFFSENIYPYQRYLSSDKEIPCTSAFNGLCIYDNDAYRQGTYLDGHFRRCEHLTFNRGIARATRKRMLIDPNLVLMTPSDHSEQTFATFLYRRTKKLLSQSIGPVLGGWAWPTSPETNNRGLGPLQK